MSRSSPDSSATLAAWQPAPTKSGKPFDLASVDTGAKPYSIGSKADDKAAVESIAAEIDALQDIFFADKRFKLLVVLQGTDTSGKDGTVRGVFGRASPLGVRTSAWKAPTEEERAHDILWRIHSRMPGSGEIMVFNRSHYEDVLVPVVNGWLTPEQTAERYRQLNDFERLLCESGTTVLKFMLHISADEQRKRLQERIDDQSKHWKFSIDDLSVRKQWNDYQKAYAAMLGATSTARAPWTVVPADSKTHRNLMIATVVRDTLKNLGLRYPPAKPELKGLKVV